MFRVSRRLGDRNGPVDAAAALLEGLQDDGLAGQIDAGGRERQGLGDPAAGVMQDEAEGAHGQGRLFGRREEGRALGGGQVQPFSLGVVQVHDRKSRFETVPIDYRFNSGEGQGGRGFFRRRLRCPAKPATASLPARAP